MNFKLIDDGENFNREFTKYLYYFKGNKIYRKEPLEKKYRLFKKFKNATKAKKFFSDFILENGITYVGGYKINIFTSTRWVMTRMLLYKSSTGEIFTICLNPICGKAVPINPDNYDATGIQYVICEYCKYTMMFTRERKFEDKRESIL